MAVYFLSDINRRSSNEDSYCDIEFRVNHEAAVHAMAVADGMGGLAGGKQYSGEAVRLFHEKLLRLLMGEEFKDSSLESQMELLTDYCSQTFQQINQELYMRGLNAGMKGGTTLTAAIHFWDRWIIANCGDSPAFCLKDGQLRLVSDIQNAAWYMVRDGQIKEGTVIYYQNKSRLLQYLGRREQVKPFITILKDEETDGLLIGTDGAFGDLTAEEMGRIIRKTHSTSKYQELLTEIFEAAKEKGEEDNQTAVLYISKQEEQDYGVTIYNNRHVLQYEEYDNPKEAVLPCEEENVVSGSYRRLEEKGKTLIERLREYRFSGGKGK